MPTASAWASAGSATRTTNGDDGANGLVSFVFMDDKVTFVTGVSNDQEQVHKRGWPGIDLQGRHLSEPPKGLYTQGNKQIIKNKLRNHRTVLWLFMLGNQIMTAIAS